jgi:hypothetical protein
MKFALQKHEPTLTSIRRQVFNRVVESTHEAGLGRKNAWINLLWSELLRRRAANELSEILFPDPPPAQEVRKPRLLSQMWLDTAHEGEVSDPEPTGGGASSSAAAEAPMPEPDPALAVVEEHMTRIDEESRCREIVSRLAWADYVPNRPKLQEEWWALEMLAGEYIETFLEGLTRDYDTTQFPRNMRLWVSETIWYFDALAEKGWTPRSLHMPHDKFIRNAANQVDEHIGDPGNLCFDVTIHVLRLWRYIGETRLQKVMRVAPQAYGERGNKSSKGPVNLRGNIIEALISDLQRMAVDRPPKGWHKGGAQWWSPGQASGSGT